MNLRIIIDKIESKKEGERVSKIELSPGESRLIKAVLNCENGKKITIETGLGEGKFGIRPGYNFLSETAEKLIKGICKPGIDVADTDEIDKSEERYVFRLNPIIPIYLLYNGKYLFPKSNIS